MEAEENMNSGKEDGVIDINSLDIPNDMDVSKTDHTVPLVPNIVEEVELGERIQNTYRSPSYKTLGELSEVSRVLLVLSTLDALTLFCMTKDGIEAKTTTHKKIGMPRKLYYTRLAQLKNVELIEKRGKCFTGLFLTINNILIPWPPV